MVGSSRLLRSYLTFLDPDQSSHDLPFPPITEQLHSHSDGFIPYSQLVRGINCPADSSPPQASPVDVPIQPSHISLVHVNGSMLLEVKWASTLLPLHSCWGTWQPKFTSEPTLASHKLESHDTASEGSEKRRRDRPVQRGRRGR